MQPTILFLWLKSKFEEKKKNKRERERRKAFSFVLSLSLSLSLFFSYTTYDHSCSFYYRFSSVTFLLLHEPIVPRLALPQTTTRKAIDEESSDLQIVTTVTKTVTTRRTCMCLPLVFESFLFFFPQCFLLCYVFYKQLKEAQVTINSHPSSGEGSRVN